MSIGKKLFDTSTRHLFSVNAFRVMGVSIESTMTEINERLDEKRLHVELGLGTQSLGQVRDARNRLNDPETRIIDELFWFWPLKAGEDYLDRAMDFVRNGNLRDAREVWLESVDQKGRAGRVARHNLALHGMFMVLEGDQVLDNPLGITPVQLAPAQKYWLGAIENWIQIAGDALWWDCVKRRVQDIDDPRLTVDTVITIRRLLPQALCKIHAELAIGHLEIGANQLASMFVDMMEVIDGSLGGFDVAAESVLGVVRGRIEQAIVIRELPLPGGPESAKDTCRALLQLWGQTKPLFDLFGDRLREFSDDVANSVGVACDQLLRSCLKESDNYSECLGMFREVLLISSSGELRAKVQKVIGSLELQIDREAVLPIVSLLQEVRVSRLSPLVKLERLKADILPKARKVQAQMSRSGAFVELRNSIASDLLDIVIDAMRAHDFGAARSAVDLAMKWALDAELKLALADVKRDLKDRANKEFLILVGNKKVVVNQERLSYKGRAIRCVDVLGVRAGGIKHSIRVDVWGRGGVEIDIECKRLFGGDLQARSDFGEIWSALYFHVVPALVSRLANRIVSGNDVELGDNWMGPTGITVTKGSLFWKKEFLIGWPDVRCSISSGHLYLSSATTGGVSVTYVLRDVWNAIILEEIAQKVLELMG